MSWLLGNQTGTATSTANPRVQNFNIGADGNVLVVVAEVDSPTDLLGTDATFDGEPMTYVGSASNTDHALVMMWELEHPHTGTCQFSVPNALSETVGLVMASFVPSTGAGALSRSNTGEGTSTNPSINVTGTVANSLMVGACTDGYRNQVTQGANYTSLRQRDAGNWTFCSEYDLDSSSAGTIAVNFVLSTSDTWGIVAASFVTAVPPRSVSLKVAQITSSGQPLTIQKGAVSVPLSKAQIVAQGQGATVSAGALDITVNLQAARITSVGKPVIPYVSYNYYVATVAGGGSDSNPGTIDEPWLTIEYGLNQVAPGDVLFVREGSYHEEVYTRINGTEIAPITIRGYPGETAIVDGEGHLPVAPYTLVAIEHNYYNIYDLEIANSSADGILLNGDHAHVNNVYCHEIFGNGIGLIGDDIIVENSTVYHVGLRNILGDQASYPEGIYAFTTTNSVIRHCLAHVVYGEGINIHNSTYTTVEDNISHDNWSMNVYISDATNILVQRNKVYLTGIMDGVPNNLQVGISIMDEVGTPWSADNTIINNLVYGTHICIYAASNFNSYNGLIIANNTCVNSAETACIKINRDAGTQYINSRFENNIVRQDDALPMIDFNFDPTGMTFSHNLWSKTPDARANGTHDVVDDPKLTETDTWTNPLWYRLAGTSPAIGAGETLASVTGDYWETERSDPPSIGAHEYTYTGNIYLEFAQITTSGLLVTISIGASSVNIQLNVAQINAQGQILDVQPGAKTTGLSVAQIIASGKILTVQEGEVSKLLGVAQISSSGQQLDVQPGDVTTNLDPAQITSIGQNATITAPAPGAIQVNLGIAQITSSGKALTIQEGAVSTSLDAAQISVNGQRVTISAPAPGAIQINLSVAQIASSGKTLSIQEGAVSISLNAAQISVQGKTLNVQAGAVSISLGLARISTQGKNVTISAPAPGIQVALDAAQITISGQHIISQGGAVTTTLDAALIYAIGEPFEINPIPPTPPAPAECIPGGGGGLRAKRNIVVILPEDRTKKKQIRDEEVLILH